MQLDLLLAAGVNGGVRRRPRSPHGHGASGLGFAAGEEKEGERERQVAEGVLCLQGGPGSEGTAVASTAARRSWRQCLPCCDREGADR